MRNSGHNPSRSLVCYTSFGTFLAAVALIAIDGYRIRYGNGSSRAVLLTDLASGAKLRPQYGSADGLEQLLCLVFAGYDHDLTIGKDGNPSLIRLHHSGAKLFSVLYLSQNG